MRKKVVNSINKLIGKINTDPTKPYINNSIIFPKTIKDILVTTLDMKIGDKVSNNPKIPDVFLKTNKKEVIASFLNQAFSDDGSAYYSKQYKNGTLNYGGSVEITSLNKKLKKKIKDKNLYKYGANLVNDCKLLLEKLDIKVNGPYCKQEYIRKKYGRKEIIHSWGIQIQRKQNIQKFKEQIGFSIPRKNKKIDEILKNYKDIEHGASLKDAYNKVINLNKDDININTETFAKERNCTKENARYLLKCLRKKSIIKRSGGGHIKGIQGCSPHEYKLINQKLC